MSGVEIHVGRSRIFLESGQWVEMPRDVWFYEGMIQGFTEMWSSS
jgi:hypothetical protein